jgi:hypothetical protein
MVRFAALLGVVLVVLAGRDVQAQDFFYVPPGYADGYYYGLDLGYGVGFGYGIGVGVPVTAQMLNSSTTAPAWQSDYNSVSNSQQGYGQQSQYQQGPSLFKAKVTKQKVAKAKSMKAAPLTKKNAAKSGGAMKPHEKLHGDAAKTGAHQG